MPVCVNVRQSVSMCVVVVSWRFSSSTRTLVDHRFVHRKRPGWGRTNVEKVGTRYPHGTGRELSGNGPIGGAVRRNIARCLYPHGLFLPCRRMVGLCQSNRDGVGTRRDRDQRAPGQTAQGSYERRRGCLTGFSHPRLPITIFSRSRPAAILQALAHGSPPSRGVPHGRRSFFPPHGMV